MKKFIIILLCLLLSACSSNSGKVEEPTLGTDTAKAETVNGENAIVSENETEIKMPNETIETETYPIVILSGNRQYGYVVGGLVNGEMIDFQENDNYKFFKLKGNEKYMIFPSMSTPFQIEGENIEEHYVEATGTHEFIVSFKNEITIDSDDFCVGIGNVVTPVEYGAEEFIDDNGSFCLDFDNDGYTERVIIDKTEDSECISIVLENKQDATILVEFSIDDTYTTGFGLLPIDVDGDSSKELVIIKEGHDYSTEIFKITSVGHEKIIGYYMGN